MSENIILNIESSKKAFHKERAAISYEEKFAIVIKLQEIDMEIRGAKYKEEQSYKRVWKLNEVG